MTLCFRKISHAYNDSLVLSELNLEVTQGEITCLLGPSGGGKSTLLRLAAGLERVQSGSVELGGKVLATSRVHPAPENRPIGLMFQDNALFPHMSVEENVTFGLSQISKVERESRVQKLLAMVGMSEFAKRYPHQLSGGQQQRIALIRSLAPQPSILLMDEPFASIDVTLRRAVRESTRQILKQSNTTAVVVTHDPNEAMEMGDKIAILDEGKIVQVDSPQKLFNTPETPTVASLFGDAQSFLATFKEGFFETAYGKISTVSEHAFSSGEECLLVVRPEGFVLEKDASSVLQIIDVRFVGETWVVFIHSEQSAKNMPPLRVSLKTVSDIKIGDKVQLSMLGESSFIFPSNNS